MLLDGSLTASVHHITQAAAQAPLLATVVRVLFAAISYAALIPCFARAFRVDASDDLVIEVSIPAMR